MQARVGRGPLRRNATAGYTRPLSPHPPYCAMTVAKPETRPSRPYFSSGPCVKRPGWTLDVLKDAFISRSHRAKDGLAKLKEVIVRSR